MPFSTCKHVIIAVQNICIVAFGSGTGHLSVDYKFMIGWVGKSLKLEAVKLQPGRLQEVSVVLQNNKQKQVHRLQQHFLIYL